MHDEMTREHTIATVRATKCGLDAVVWRLCAFRQVLTKNGHFWTEINGPMRSKERQVREALSCCTRSQGRAAAIARRLLWQTAKTEHRRRMDRKRSAAKAVATLARKRQEREEATR